MCFGHSSFSVLDINIWGQKMCISTWQHLLLQAATIAEGQGKYWSHIADTRDRD